MKKYYQINGEYLQHTEGENCLVSVDPRCYRDYSVAYGHNGFRVFSYKLIKIYNVNPLSDSEVMVAILIGEIDLSLADTAIIEPFGHTILKHK